MIVNVESYTELITEFRNEIILQSELPGSRIRNANSVRGQDLSKLIFDRTYEGYNFNDLIILFEILEDSDNHDNVSFIEKDNITQYVSYKAEIIVYGKGCGLLSNKLKSRLLSSKVINDLYSKGIYLSDISEIQSMNEFINNTYYDRCDFTIYLGCKYEHSQISKEETITENYDVNIHEFNI